MPLLRIQHLTTYHHRFPTAMSWQLARLQPRTEPGQELLSFDLEITPRTGDLGERTDFYGNRCQIFTVRGPLTELTLRSVSRVRRQLPPRPAAELTPPLAEAGEAIAAAIQSGQFALEQYRHPSPYVPFLPAAAALAEPLDQDTLPLLQWLEALGTVFARQFTFDAHATTISTPLAEVLRLRRGVCQDFTHAMISCLRQHGLPAAYVSGYLLTQPPPGKPRLRGADAMHAWVSVWLPGAGWIDYDPTNRCFAGDSHVVVARGRDYAEVSPLRGIFRGGAAHSLSLGVTVEPAEEAPATPAPEEEPVQQQAPPRSSEP